MSGGAKQVLDAFEQLPPGERGIAEIRTKEPIVATHGQPFILRRISPSLTVAGGTVLDPQVPPSRRIKDIVAYGEALSGRTELDRLSFLVRQRDLVEPAPLEAAARAGIAPQRSAELIEQLKARGDLVPIGGGERPLLVHRDRLAALSRAVLRGIKAEIARHQPRTEWPAAGLRAPAPHPREGTRAPADRSVDRRRRPGSAPSAPPAPRAAR